MDAIRRRMGGASQEGVNLYRFQIRAKLKPTKIIFSFKNEAFTLQSIPAIQYPIDRIGAESHNFVCLSQECEFPFFSCICTYNCHCYRLLIFKSQCFKDAYLQLHSSWSFLSLCVLLKPGLVGSAASDGGRGSFAWSAGCG